MSSYIEGILLYREPMVKGGGARWDEKLIRIDPRQGILSLWELPAPVKQPPTRSQVTGRGISSSAASASPSKVPVLLSRFSLSKAAVFTARHSRLADAYFEVVCSPKHPADPKERLCFASLGGPGEREAWIKAISGVLASLNAASKVPVGSPSNTKRRQQLADASVRESAGPGSVVSAIEGVRLLVGDDDEHQVPPHSQAPYRPHSHSTASYPSSTGADDHATTTTTNNASSRQRIASEEEEMDDGRFPSQSRHQHQHHHHQRSRSPPDFRDSSVLLAASPSLAARAATNAPVSGLRGHPLFFGSPPRPPLPPLFGAHANPWSPSSSPKRDQQLLLVQQQQQQYQAASPYASTSLRPYSQQSAAAAASMTDEVEGEEHEEGARRQPLYLAPATAAGPAEAHGNGSDIGEEQAHAANAITARAIEVGVRAALESLQQQQQQQQQQLTSSLLSSSSSAAPGLSLFGAAAAAGGSAVSPNPSNAEAVLAVGVGVAAALAAAGVAPSTTNASVASSFRNSPLLASSATSDASASAPPPPPRSPPAPSSLLSASSASSSKRLTGPVRRSPFPSPKLTSSSSSGAGFGPSFVSNTSNNGASPASSASAGKRRESLGLQPLALEPPATTTTASAADDDDASSSSASFALSPAPPPKKASSSAADSSSEEEDGEARILASSSSVTELLASGRFGPSVVGAGGAGGGRAPRASSLSLIAPLPASALSSPPSSSSSSPTRQAGNASSSVSAAAATGSTDASGFGLVALDSRKRRAIDSSALQQSGELSSSSSPSASAVAAVAGAAGLDSDDDEDDHHAPVRRATFIPGSAEHLEILNATATATAAASASDGDGDGDGDGDEAKAKAEDGDGEDLASRYMREAAEAANAAERALPAVQREYSRPAFRSLLAQHGPSIKQLVVSRCDATVQLPPIAPSSEEEVAEEEDGAPTTKTNRPLQRKPSTTTLLMMTLPALEGLLIESGFLLPAMSESNSVDKMKQQEGKDEDGRSKDGALYVTSQELMASLQALGLNSTNSDSDSIDKNASRDAQKGHGQEEGENTGKDLLGDDSASPVSASSPSPSPSPLSVRLAYPQVLAVVMMAAVIAHQRKINADAAAKARARTSQGKAGEQGQELDEADTDDESFSPLAPVFGRFLLPLHQKSLSTEEEDRGEADRDTTSPEARSSSSSSASNDDGTNPATSPVDGARKYEAAAEDAIDIDTTTNNNNDNEHSRQEGQ